MDDQVFKPQAIEAAVLPDDSEFKKDAEPFEYADELGVIRGYRHKDGTLLITEIECPDTAERFTI